MPRVVVVDDQAFNLKMVRMTLESEGYEVIPLQDPLALENLIVKTRIDAIILDLMMPGLSGFDLIELLRGNPQTKHTPIIVLTSKKEAPDRVRGLRAGADDYICKPFDPAELIVRLEGLLERKLLNESSLQGSLRAMPIWELLQFIAQTMKIGTLHIQSQDQVGFLQINEGFILDGRFGPFHGPAAVEAMLELEHGIFRFSGEDLPKIDQTSPAVTLQELLLNFVWVSDELSSRLQYLPKETDRLWMSEKRYAIPPSMAKMPITKVVNQVKSLPGISLEGILSRGLSPPNQMRLAIAWLIEHQMILTKPLKPQVIVE